MPKPLQQHPYGDCIPVPGAPSAPATRRPQHQAKTMTPITTREAIHEALKALSMVQTPDAERAAWLLCEQYGFKMQEFFVEDDE